MVDGLSQDRETAGCVGVYDKQQVCPLGVLSAHSTGGLWSLLISFQSHKPCK